MKKLCRIFTAGVICALICISASGLAACKKKSTAYTVLDIYEAYQDDATSFGKTAEDYDSWIARMGITDEEAEVSSIETDTEGRVINVVYKDGAEASYPLPDLYTVTASNQYGGGCEKVYFSLYYETTRNELITKDGAVTLTEVTDENVVQTTSSDSDGKAIFYYYFEEGVTYMVRLADSTEISDGSSNIPDKHSVYGFADGETYVMYVTAAKGGSASYSLKYTANGLLNNYTKINYSRYYNLTSSVKTEDKGDIIEINEPYEGEATAYTFTYLQFNPYVTPENYYTYGSEDDETADAIVRAEYARQAATGTYRITLESAAEGSVMYMYSYTYQSLLASYTNDDGEPTAVKYITGTAVSGSGYDSSLYTGTNYIDLNYDSYMSGADRIFGIMCPADCDIKVTVQRIGDSTEVETEDITVEIDKSAQAYTDTLANPILAPTDGSVPTTLGSDGYYHFVNADGPIIYVQLINVVSRYNTKRAVSYVSTESGFTRIQTITDEEYRPLQYIRWGEMIQAYAALANSQGLYPVNEQLYEYLNVFKASTGDYSWLLPCYYEEQDGGLPVEGSGTYTDPYILHSDKNTVAAAVDEYGAYLGTTYFKYSNGAGIYQFSSNSQPLAIVGNLNLQTYLDGRIRTVMYTGETTQMYSISGYTGTIMITVSDLSESDSYTDTADITTSDGTADSPYTVYVGNVFTMFVTDGVYATNGVYITFAADPLGIEGIGNSYAVNVGFIRDGVYAGATITYNGTTYRGSELVLTFTDKDTSYTLYFASGTAKYLMITFIEVDSSDTSLSYTDDTSAVSLDLSTGLNSVTLDDINYDYTYYFTVSESGWYKFEADNTGIWINIGDTKILNPSDDTIPNIYYIEAGTTVTLTIRANEHAGKGVHTITITSISSEDAANIKHTATVGTSYTISLSAGGAYRFYIELEDSDAGSYTITVSSNTASETYTVTIDTEINRNQLESTSTSGTYAYTTTFDSGEHYIVIYSADINTSSSVTVTITKNDS